MTIHPRALTAAVSGIGGSSDAEEGRQDPAAVADSDPKRLSSGPPEADNAYQICLYSLSSVTAFDVLRQLVERLITEFDRAKSDTCVALRLRWVQLPQSDDGLAVALLIERDGGAEYAWIIVFVGAMIDLDQVRPIDAPELHPVRISLAVGSDHIEPPFAVDANIH